MTRSSIQPDSSCTSRQAPFVCVRADDNVTVDDDEAANRDDELVGWLDKGEVQANAKRQRAVSQAGLFDRDGDFGTVDVGYDAEVVGCLVDHPKPRAPIERGDGAVGP